MQNPKTAPIATLPLLTVLIAALVQGCAAPPTPYGPAAAANGNGYAEQQIEGNRYRVTFQGNYQTARTQVDSYLLYRAAEITLLTHNDYFVVTQQNTDPSTYYQSTFDTLGGGFGYGYGFYGGGFYDPFWGGPSVATGTSRPYTRYQAFADIQVFPGAKPVNQPNAYDAHDVVTRLGSLVQQPPAA